jgi:diguanylate cyclase (GGDEF)-like protein
VPWRIAITSSLGALAFWAMAWGLWHQRRYLSSWFETALCGAFVLYGALLLIRAVWSVRLPETRWLESLVWVHGLTFLSMQLILILISLSVLWAASRRLEEELRTLATRDPLTGLYNRRALEELGAKEISRTIRSGVPVAVIVIDIDHFKPLNDHYGHQAGDVVLKWLASVMRNHVREHDVLARFGGEEFVVLLPETALEAATIVAEKLRAEIERAAIMFGKTGRLNMTASFGVASLFGERANWFSLIKAADDALYAAKAAGRNCVKVAE